MHVEADRPFVRGDAGFDGKVDVSDAVSILRTLFLLGDAPIGCEDAADADDDGAVTIADCVAVFGYLFQGGPPPAPPFPEPGVDPTPDAMACTARS